MVDGYRMDLSGFREKILSGEEFVDLLDSTNPEDHRFHYDMFDYDFFDFHIRKAVCEMRQGGVDASAICGNPLPPVAETEEQFYQLRPMEHPYQDEQAFLSEQTVLKVALDSLPLPSAECSWERLLDFRKEVGDEEWAFRRFLRDLAGKKRTEVEVRDDIEWSLNEYSKAMALHKIKSSNSFVDVFLITPLEIIENLVKFNWSKIAKGALQVNKRRAETTRYTEGGLLSPRR